ncbi:MAG: DEAD/DEAH box helicase [Candidatus Nomurabacteria bacterium]|jgi:superfamily II DNA/RNA helicase|nr:DEAD/DEAH box helicase [Candidatus Nomurabacteria bacterium]
MPNYRKTRPQRGGQGGRGRAPFNKNSSNRNGGGQRRPNKRRGAYIHPSKFINQASTVNVVAEYQARHRFADFPFVEAIQANIRSQGYKVPSAIQDQAISHIMAGRDIIGLANTGTGKTAAFLLPIINQLYASRKPLSAIVLAPTRELAQQIDDQFRIFSSGMKLYSTLLVGGAPINKQIASLRRRPHIVIATPGRTMDLIKRKVLRLDDIDVLVLDEADRMLDMGFVGDIRTITSQTPEDRQTLFFSATITPQVEQLTKEFLRDPKTISVRTADTSESVDQNVVEADSKEEKMEKLMEMLGQDEFEKVLLFGETKHGVQRLSDRLNKQGVNSVAIHGNKSQSQRKSALKSFKDNQSRVMVATDVAARGLDIPNVSHVINFDQPATYEDYVHRIGRTGRAGATGKALTFVGKR